MGRDFRSAVTGQSSTDEELSFGIPQAVGLKETVSEVSLGKNHMLLMSKPGEIFTLGSN